VNDAVNELDAAIRTIDRAVPDPRLGLGERIFHLVSRLTPMVNVDLLLLGADGAILMTWRADPFYGPGWHIPGGVLRYKESYAERIAAVAQSELGTRVEFDEPPRRVTPVTNPERATRGHFISLLFDCRLLEPPDPALRHAGGAPEHGQWAWHRERPPDLIPVHERLYGDLFRTNGTGSVVLTGARGGSGIRVSDREGGRSTNETHPR